MKSMMYTLVFMCLVCLSENAFAQLKPWSKMFTFDGGYAMVTSDETSHSMDGYTFGVGFEQLNMDGNWSGGVGLMYLNSKDTNDETAREISYSSMPIILYGKYLFGSGKFNGYILGGAGLQFSNVDYTGKEIYLSNKDSGFALQLGAGGYMFFNEKMFLNVSYNFMLLGNSYYQDGIVSLFKVGLGFQYD